MWGRNQINIPEPVQSVFVPNGFEQPPPDVMNVNRVNLVLVTRQPINQAWSAN